GFTAGPITGIKLFCLLFSEETRHLMIRMAHTGLGELTTEDMTNDLDTVFYDYFDFGTYGFQDFNFFQPFEWDGQSNILVDFSFTNPQAGNTTLVFGQDPGFNCGIAAGADNRALDLDGNTDFARLPEARYFTGNFTFECWFYKRSDNWWSRIFDFGNGGGQENVLVALSKENSGKLSVHVKKGGITQSFDSEPIPTHEWTHVAVGLWNQIGFLYINGDSVDIGLLQPPGDLMRTLNYIGKSNWSNDGYADVLLDEFRIFNRKLSSAEIRDHYRRGLENPQSDTSLVAYFNFNESEGNIIYDLSVNGHDANLYGLPGRYDITGPEIFMDFHQYNVRPYIIFERLISSGINVTYDPVLDTVVNNPEQLIWFLDPVDPTIPTDTTEVYRAGWQYVYENWHIVDSLWAEPDSVIYRQDLPYYGEPFEIIEDYEIGRFITPYGIGLSLGPQGFPWVFDVTDYAPLLQGAVDLSAGNQQELIDLKFLMIKGTPPRDVLQIDRLWNPVRSYYYKDLDDDLALPEITVPLLPEASQFRVKTRLTGHGHNSNTGEYPHCCEWKDNTHYLHVNGQETAAWHIFQYHDCALNPVFPQGGTWPGAREGWCPGDLVKVQDWEITDYINGDEVTLDYDITPVPPDNLGMGWGNYVVAMHLIHYGENHFQNDAEVYDVISPSSTDYYRRMNPVCMDPAVIIRNNGTAPLTSLTLHYGVSGGTQETWEWSGNLLPYRMDTVYLPVPGGSFWIGDTLHRFTVTINGLQDEYPDNDSFSTIFNMPDFHAEPFIILLRTNHEAYRYSLRIRDIWGQTWLEWDDLENNTFYQDTIDFPDGCYTLELTDEEDMGLSYWAYPTQGAGYLRLLNIDSTMLKVFNSEFGRSIFYTFNLGETYYIEENGLEDEVRIYPNPAGDVLYMETGSLEGIVTVRMLNMQGQSMMNRNEYVSPGGIITLPVADLPRGLYLAAVGYLNGMISVKIRKK
ncbi:MAG: T9SS type A sorting domain-containing protein, partial [Bacteroidales bacterium]|nr:T9SS type A sorting domain-containing protein [Bacteroidales bacterium]